LQYIFKIIRKALIFSVGKFQNFFNIRAGGTCLGGRNWGFVKCLQEFYALKCNEGIKTFDNVPYAQ